MRVYPFKSLPGADVPTAALTLAGSLVRDREFALFDDVACLTAKREPRMHALRVTYDASLERAEFYDERGDARFGFGFDDDPGALQAWLGELFGRPVTVRRNETGGFPDDTSAPGPTVVSSATLAAVATWFGDLDAASVRDRLRTNIEIDGVPAFWEDRLFGKAGSGVAFAVSGVAFEGLGPCARCIVPSRDARSGVPMPEFAKRVAERRAATLPSFAERSRFDHFYRLAVTTRALDPTPNASVRVGDPVRLSGLAITS